MITTTCNCPECRGMAVTFSVDEKDDEQLYATVKQDVQTSGLAFVAIPWIAYTVGLSTGRWKHPELVLLGAGVKAVGILINLVKRIERQRLHLHHQSMLVHNDTRLLFLDVAEHRKRHLEFCARYHAEISRPYEALQIIWPDKNNRLPGEYGYIDDAHQSWTPFDEQAAAAN